MSTFGQNIIMQRYANTLLYQGVVVQRYSDIFGESVIKQRYANSLFGQSVVQQRYSNLTTAYEQAIGSQSTLPTYKQTPPPGENNFYGYLTPGLRLWFHFANGTNFMLADSSQNMIEEFEITFMKNQGVRWQATLLFQPQNLGINKQTLINLLKTQPFTSGLVIGNYIQGQMLVGGELIPLPNLVILNSNYEDDPDYLQFTLEGECASTHLMGTRNQNVTSFVSTQNYIYTAKSILQTFLPAMGINNFVLNFDDFPVRKLHVQNESPSSIMNQLLEVPRAGWCVYGDTVYTFPFFWQQPASASWVVQDVPNMVFKLGETFKIGELINVVKGNLHLPSGIKGGSVNASKWGIFHTSFSTGLINPKFVIQNAINGQIAVISYYGKNGELVGVQSNPLFPSTQNIPLSSGLAYKAVLEWAPPGQQGSISSTYDQPTSLSGTYYGSDPLGIILDNYTAPYGGEYLMPSWLLNYSTNYVGGQAITTPAPSGISPNQMFSIVVDDPTSVNVYGIKESDQPIDKALIPNLQWLWRFCVGVLAESKANQIVIPVTIPPNPFIRVGDSVQIIENIKGINRIGQVMKHTITFNPQEAFSELTIQFYGNPGI